MKTRGTYKAFNKGGGLGGGRGRYEWLEIEEGCAGRGVWEEIGVRWPWVRASGRGWVGGGGE